MKLYILRHGEAADHGDGRYASDGERPLTPKGIKRTRQLTNALRQMDITFDDLIHSLVQRGNGGMWRAA
jgi:phosphohistidine phosphatase SixA